MRTRTALSTGSLDNIHARWVMPEIFHDLPVTVEDDGETIRILEELSDRALPGASEDDRTRFAVVCALGLDDLIALGVEYAGVCVAAFDDTPCTATVLATLVDSPEGAVAPVRTLASDLRRVSAGEVTEIDLPCGPAVSCVGTRQERMSGEMMHAGAPLAFPTAFIRVYVPLPNASTLVMEMCTPTMVGWDAFSTMFGNIVSSIRLFHADGSSLIVPGAQR
ncbi:hypothetical protein B1H18_10410 [Streptomyces tsukubensis]|uniref:Uncharacterized protein n=1 Tax=Streptomyces tsukubensis TaxID=83656 RepID=A0A1V4ABY0_9ACTN|nr:hypothetical protein B1H18_10410 [Streptomyces tsukubensis]